jgi:hypothetical protein
MLCRALFCVDCELAELTFILAKKVCYVTSEIRMFVTQTSSEKRRFLPLFDNGGFVFAKISLFLVGEYKLWRL